MHTIDLPFMPRERCVVHVDGKPYAGIVDSVTLQAADLVLYTTAFEVDMPDIGLVSKKVGVWAPDIGRTLFPADAVPEFEAMV